MTTHGRADASQASMTMIVIAFAALYVIWGSTYLGIKFAVETLPPFLMAGVRFVIAGAILWVVLRWRGEATPKRAEIRTAALVGVLLLTGGNGLVTWAEQWVPSGVTALIVGSSPLWIVMLDWLWIGSARPTAPVFAGLAVGFAGVTMLSWREGGESASGPAWAPLVLLAACALWAVGSLHSKRRKQGNSLLMAAAVQMIAGGFGSVLVGTAMGEWGRVDPASVSIESLLAFAYLVFVGSIAGFSAYVYLLNVVSPAAVSTYAYVNPLIAVLLGWAIGGEAVDAGMAVAAVMIVGAVALMTWGRGRKPATTVSTVPKPAAAAPGAEALAVAPDQCVPAE